MKKLIFIGLLFSAMMLFAQEGHEGREGRGGHEGPEGEMMMGKEMLDAAGIPETKQTEIRKEMHDIKQKAMDAQFKVQEERIAMKAELEKPNPDKAKITESIKKIAEMKKEQIIMMETTKINMLFKLTPDQRKKIMEMMMEKRKKFMHHMMKGED